MAARRTIPYSEYLSDGFHRCKNILNFGITKIECTMPEVFRQFGFVFFFYTNESQVPLHIHIRKAGGFAKFRIEPVVLDFAQDMKITYHK